MSTVIDVIVTGKTAGPYAKMINDRKRECYLPFVVFSYPKGIAFKDVQAALDIMCGSVLGGNTLEALKATGTWNGEQEASCVVILPDNKHAVLWPILALAFDHFQQEAVIAVSRNRQACLYTDIPDRLGYVTISPEYLGIWESRGNKKPEGEDYTEVAGVYYTIRKRKGE